MRTVYATTTLCDGNGGVVRKFEHDDPASIPPLLLRTEPGGVSHDGKAVHTVEFEPKLASLTATSHRIEFAGVVDLKIDFDIGDGDSSQTFTYGNPIGFVLAVKTKKKI